MSHHEHGAADQRRGRRRHAPQRRGRGPVWLVALGGVAVLGITATLLTGGSRPGADPNPPADGGSAGLPRLIQPEPDADETSGTPRPADAAGGTGAPSASSSGTATPGTTASGTPTGAPSATETTAPSDGGTDGGDAADAPDATADPEGSDGSGHPGRGRGATKRPR
ncbi:hypothetical protein [Streptomyces sp. NPDC003327]